MTSQQDQRFDAFTKCHEQLGPDLTPEVSAMLFSLPSPGTVTASLSEIQQVAELATKLHACSCEIEIINKTNLCWVPQSHYSRHGEFAAGMNLLPSIAPKYTSKVKETVEFSVATIIESKGLSAPTAVMIWRALDSDLHLIVYADIWKHLSNDGYFGLTTVSPVNAKEWYDDNDSLKYDYGIIGNKCNTAVSGVSITGSMTNDTHSNLKVTLSA